MGAQWTAQAVSGDNWGTQVVQVNAPLTGDGTSTNPLGLNYNSTTLSVSGGQLTANNTSAIWNANQLCGTNLNCTALSGLGTGDAGKVLTWNGSQWTAQSVAAAGGWSLSGNNVALGSNFLGTTNDARHHQDQHRSGCASPTPPTTGMWGLGLRTRRTDCSCRTANNGGRALANAWLSYLLHALEGGYPPDPERPGEGTGAAWGELPLEARVRRHGGYRLPGRGGCPRGAGGGLLRARRAGCWAWTTAG
jgi:hypothetical protein